jgi:hypothetical protein
MARARASPTGALKFTRSTIFESIDPFEASPAICSARSISLLTGVKGDRPALSVSHLDGFKWAPHRGVIPKIHIIDSASTTIFHGPAGYRDRNMAEFIGGAREAEARDVGFSENHAAEPGHGSGHREAIASAEIVDARIHSKE